VEVSFDLMDPQASLKVSLEEASDPPGEIDLTPWLIMEYLRFAILDTDSVSWISIGIGETAPG
jgi:hypothetical protein